MVHHLKIHVPYFIAVRYGYKTAEIRKADRYFKIGDEILFTPVLCEGSPADIKIKLNCLITRVVRGGQFGIRKGYDMLSIKLISEIVGEE